MVVGCDTDDTADTGEPAATGCDFSSIAGTWTGTVSSGESQVLNLEPQAEFDASIGTNVFSNDAGEPVCSFDVQCKPSATEGTFLVFNERVEAVGVCLEGWYTMELTDGALAVGIHLTEEGDLGTPYELSKE